jgi:hypothetical protein
MDVMQARLDLARALETVASVPHAADRFRAARQMLTRHGAGVPHIDPTAGTGLLDLVERAACAPASPARRRFAVLLVDALAVPGLLSERSSQARLDRGIRTLVERALPDVLLRAGYPFGADVDAKRRFLSALHATIEDHLRPLEPTIPTWLSGRPDR